MNDSDCPGEKVIHSILFVIIICKHWTIKTNASGEPFGPEILSNQDGKQISCGDPRARKSSIELL
jgi:hypothetical protein